MRLKFFFLSLIFSVPLWMAVNGLGEEITTLRKTETLNKASVLSVTEESKKTKIVVPEPQLTAQAYVAVEILPDGKENLLFGKNYNEKLPIASLSKLMTANVVLENYDSTSQVVIVSDEVAQYFKDFGNLRAGERFSINNLLYSMLLESNNEAADVISETIGKPALVDLMNLEAKKFNLTNTVFYNPSGIDPRKDENQSEINISSAYDIAKLTEYLIKNLTASEILSTPQKQIVDIYGNEHHLATTTNKLLLDGDYLDGKKIIAGKTGETLRAGECLVIVLENEKTNNKLINVILNSNDRFEEMKKLVAWVDSKYNW